MLVCRRNTLTDADALHVDGQVLLQQQVAPRVERRQHAGTHALRLEESVVSWTCQRLRDINGTTAG